MYVSVCVQTFNVLLVLQCIACITLIYAYLVENRFFYVSVEPLSFCFEHDHKLKTVACRYKEYEYLEEWLPTSPDPNDPLAAAYHLIRTAGDSHTVSTCHPGFDSLEYAEFKQWEDRGEVEHAVTSAMELESLAATEAQRVWWSSFFDWIPDTVATANVAPACFFGTELHYEYPARPALF